MKKYRISMDGAAIAIQLANLLRLIFKHRWLCTISFY
jgi:hypothetical protein